MKKGFKYKVINHAKKIKYVGFLDKNARTGRVFSKNPDKIEVVLLGLNNDDSHKLLLIEENIIDGQVSEEACCGDDDEHNHNYSHNTKKSN